MKKFKSLFILGLSAFFLTGCLSTPAEGPQGGEPSGGDSDPSGGQKTVNVVSYTIADLAALYGWSNAEQHSSFMLNSVIEISSSGTGSNTGKYYSGDQTYRLYSSEQSKITITAKEGRTLQSVTITYNSNNQGTLVDLPSGTAKEVSGTSVSFQTSSSGQARVTAISVSYLGEAGTAPEGRKNWKDDELAILDEYLYGVEVPFINIPGIYLVYDEEYGVYVGVDDTATLDDVAAFAEAFDASEDWISVDEEILDNDIYFVNAVETDEGTRYVVANLYLIDEDDELIEDPEVEGTFYIDMYDPYYYEWDEELLSELYGFLKTESVIPEVENISCYTVTPNEEYTEFTLLFLDQEVSSLTEYEGKLTDFELTSIENNSFSGVSNKDDLEIVVSYLEDQEALEIKLIKHLPHLDEFPLAAIKEYNGGYEVPEIEGAEYFTAEAVTASLFGFEYDIGYCVTAFGIDETEYQAFVELLATEKWETREQLDYNDEYELVPTGGYVANKPINGRLYSFAFEFDKETGAVTLMYDKEPTSYVFESWFADFINTEFLAKKSVETTIPELTIAEGYYLVEVTLDSFLYYDNILIEAKGNNVESWVAILTQNGYQISDDGKSYVSGDGLLTTVVNYDEETDYTGAFFYVTADLAEE